MSAAVRLKAHAARHPKRVMWVVFPGSGAAARAAILCRLTRQGLDCKGWVEKRPQDVTCKRCRSRLGLRP